jgi:hypothetical protein
MERNRLVANVYPRETVEFIPVTVTVDGTPVTTGVQFAVVADGVRPTTFSAPVTLSGKIGVLISGLAAGNYRIWAQVTAAPETPVIECGYITIT